MNDDEKSFLAKVGIDATIVLAAATGLLYLFGTYYRIGYLEQWGIEYSLFSGDIYENLLAGFSVLHVIAMFSVIIAIVMGLSLLGYNSMAIELSRNEKIQKTINWLHRNREAEADAEPPKLLTDFENRIFKLLLIFIIILIILYAFYKSTSCSSEIGKNLAIKEYEQYSQSNKKGEQKSLFSKLRTYCIDGVPRSALMLATDRSTYALYFPKGKTQEECVEIVAASRINCIKAAKNTMP